MPQMMPMLWIFIFSYTLLCLTMTMCLTYFIFIPMIKNSHTPKKLLNWILKW